MNFYEDGIRFAGIRDIAAMKLNSGVTGVKWSKEVLNEIF